MQRARAEEITADAESNAVSLIADSGAKTVVESAVAPPQLNRRAITAALMVVMVLASMEQTITSTAMPTIIGALKGLEHYSWVASIYLLTSTISMPLNGRLADTLGRKKVILAAIALFIISSVLAATAQSMLQLIIYRGLQGLGAGGIMPVVLTILGDIFTIEERARIQGFFSGVWGTASLAGPMLGAFLVTTFGWRSIFFVNLPLGVFAMAVLIWGYHDQEKPHHVDPDLAGVGLLAVMCIALLTVVSHLGPEGWPISVSLGLVVTVIVASIFFVLHERRIEHPIMPIDLLLDRSIGPSLAGSLLLGIGFLSLDTYVPLYVQGGQGGGAGSAAWAVTPVMLTWATSGIFAAPLLIRWGFRKVATMGSILVVVGFVGLIICQMTSAPHIVLGIVLAITGIGFGPSSMSYLLAAQNAVSWQRRGIVTSAVQFFRTIGGAMGVGILGTLFNILTQPKLKMLESNGVSPAALLDPHTRESLSPAVLRAAGEMITGGLHWVFIAMLGVAVVQIWVTRWMPIRKSVPVISKLEAAEAMAG